MVLAQCAIADIELRVPHRAAEFCGQQRRLGALARGGLANEL